MSQRKLASRARLSPRSLVAAAVPHAECPLPRLAKRCPDGLLLIYIDRAFRASLAFRPSHGVLHAEFESAVLEQLAQGDVRIEQVASRLGMSTRTLHRRLKDVGLEYQGLLDTIRQRLATELLGNTLSIKEVCYRLGFSEPSAFRRAFKRWTGQSPSAYRSARRQLAIHDPGICKAQNRAE